MRPVPLSRAGRAAAARRPAVMFPMSGPRVDRRRRSHMPMLERLEGRWVPATITVTSLADDGPGTLRAAIMQAEMTSDPDTINFGPAVRGTITLQSALPDLTGPIELKGPGASDLTLARSAAAGTPEFRIVTVDSGAVVALSGLTLSGGFEPSPDFIGGGGIENSGTLTVTASIIRDNTSVDPAGGIENFDGILTVTASIISGNSAGYGAGGIECNGGTLTVNDSTINGNSGQGIFNSGTTTVNNSTITGNALGGIDNFGKMTIATSAIRGNLEGGIVNDEGTLTMTNSIISDNSDNTGSGGGIENLEGALTVANSIISGNSEGGVINGFGMLMLTDSTISGNSADYGGGLFNVGGPATVINSVISGNSATKNGGGIGNGGFGNSGTLTIQGSTISSNSAPDGGGISNTLGTLIVMGTTIGDNSALGNPTTTDPSVSVGGDGGGILNKGTLTLTDATVSHNTARHGTSVNGGSATAGGIDNAGDLTILSSTLDGNQAEAGPDLGGSGGALTNSGTATIRNATLFGNEAAAATIETGDPGGGHGGAIANSGKLTVQSSTFSFNLADSVSDAFGGSVALAKGGGGDIANSGALMVTSSIFRGLSTLVATIDGSLDQPSSGGHNLFSDRPNIALDPTDLINTNPFLGLLADNGGPTMTLALLPGSPAIDAGVAIPGVTTDQRGVPRPQGAVPDIGAFESRGFNLVIASGDPQSTPVLSDFPGPLVVNVVSPVGEPVAGGLVTFNAPRLGASATLSDNPAFIGDDGRAMTNATANGQAGTYAIDAQAAGAGSVAFHLANHAQTTAISLTTTAASSLLGQPQTITATVRDSLGTPIVGIPLTFRVLAGPNAGAVGMLNPPDGATDAQGQVSFTYIGRVGTGTDTIVATAMTPGGAVLTSSPLSITWTAMPPTVVGLQRQGFHRQPTRLVLTFSGPMDPARALNLANYRLVRLRPDHRAGHPIPLVAASLDATADAVTLSPARRLPLRGRYQLTVNGNPPAGLTDTSGTDLDGAGNDRPGSDFVAVIDRKALAGPDQTAEFRGHGPRRRPPD